MVEVNYAVGHQQDIVINSSDYLINMPVMAGRRRWDGPVGRAGAMPSHVWSGTSNCTTQTHTNYSRSEREASFYKAVSSTVDGKEYSVVENPLAPKEPTFLCFSVERGLEAVGVPQKGLHNSNTIYTRVESTFIFFFMQKK